MSNSIRDSISGIRDFRQTYYDAYYYLTTKNEEQFSKIVIPSIPIPAIGNVKYIEVSVIAINFINNIRTLVKDDFIEINGVKYISNTERKGTSAIAWAELLSDIIFDSEISVSITPTDLIKFSSKESFTINSMSYNIRNLCGFLNEDSIGSEINGNLFEIIAPSHGNYNSTPIFYLLSNIGKNSYIARENGELELRSILLKINNSSNATIPVVYSGGEHKQRFNLTDISSTIWFELTDANLKILDLLYPMTLSLKIRFFV